MIDLPTGGTSRGQSGDAPAQAIFTTGSTGAPKPALLSHRNILCQNRALGEAFDFHEDQRVLLNLPPSHVGGQAEELMTTLLCGGTAVVQEIFDPAGWEVQNMLTAALLVAECAFRRTETRGVHYREDFPNLDPAWARHQTVRRTQRQLIVK